MAKVEKVREKYRFAALVALNTFVAFYFVETVMPLLMNVTSRLFVPAAMGPDHTLARVVLLRCINTAVCAFVVGLVAARLLGATAARWVWVPSVLWLLFGMARYAIGPSESVLMREGVMHHVFSLGSGWAWIRDFSSYTLPTISGLAYSLGAFCLKSSDTPATAARGQSESVGA